MKVATSKEMGSVWNGTNLSRVWDGRATVGVAVPAGENKRDACSTLA